MVFHVILPGKPMVSAEGFTQLEPNRWVLPIEDAKAVDELVVFLSAPLSSELGLGVHIAAPPFEVSQWHFLGSIDNDTPTAVFKPRYVWSERDAMPTVAQVGLELITRAELAARIPERASNEVLEVAQLIAADLVRYISSFDDAPANVIDRWLQRFTTRCQSQGVDWLRRRDS